MSLNVAKTANYQGRRRNSIVSDPIDDIHVYLRDFDKDMTQMFSSLRQAKIFTVTEDTATFSVGESDDVLLVDSTSGTVTVNLPTAVGLIGKQFIIKDWKGQSGSNNITVDGSGSETIDGSATNVLSTNYASLRIVSDGTNWAII
jgi:hypothetical protein